MAVSPISARFPFEPQIASMPSEHQYVIRNLWNAISDAQGSIPILKNQIDAHTTAISATNETVSNINTVSETVITGGGGSNSNVAGTVNNQTGNTVYATTQADYGAYIIFDDASPIAVSLTGTPTIGLPWYCVIINYGAGLVTITPATGTISYPNNLSAISMGVPEGISALIAYDGVDFWAVLVSVYAVPPQNTPQIASQWLNSYNASTGAFGQSQPTVSDVTGAAPIASPTFTGTVTVPEISNTATQTTVSASVSGTVIFSQPEQGSSYKRVMIYLNNANGTASYTFSAPFTYIPMILSTPGFGGGLSTLVSSLSTTSVTITCPSAYTGFISLDGY